jgi:hypothetical protein
MKTLMMTSFHAHISRNLLETRVFSLLRCETGLRLVVVVPDYKEGYFKERFVGYNVIVEGFHSYQASRTMFGLFFKRLSRIAFNTGTTVGKQQYKYYWDHKWWYYYPTRVVSFFGKFFVVQNIIRYFDAHFSSPRLFENLLQKYNPDSVWITDMHNENDVALAQDAKRRNIPVIGSWRSWDNTTQQLLRVWPDRIIAGSQALYEETIVLHNFPKERMVCTGHPHYDNYTSQPKSRREDFFKYFDLDPYKKTVLFAPGGDKIIQNNDLDDNILSILSDAGIQTLVRYPPGEDVKRIDELKWPSHIAIHKPGYRFSKRPGEFVITKEDDDALIDSLHHCDVVVTGPTSVPLDAAFLDVPVIIADVYPTKRSQYEKGWGFLLDHIHKLLRTDGAWYVSSKASFLHAVDAYFKNPTLHHQGREKIKEIWFSYADGKASERVAKEILKFINI